MSAQTLIRQAGAAGVELRLIDGKVKASGNAEALTELVPQLRQHKPELIQFLQDAHVTTTALIEAAMRACDHHGDTDAARKEMRLDCLNTPQHLRADLQTHFQQTYPKAKS